MLRESEPFRRNARDDAESSRARYERYEARKRQIADEAEDADDYTDRVQALAREMGI
ncbi:hypothetical protein [Solidesulfovibrio sp.]